MIDVQKLARDAGFDVALFDINGPLVYEAEPKHVSMLIALVLEEAAKRCDEVQRMHSDHDGFARDCGNEKNQAYFKGAMIGAEDCAATIRSLKPKGD